MKLPSLKQAYLIEYYFVWKIELVLQMLSTSPLIYLKVVRMIVFPNSDLFFTRLFILVLVDYDLTWATFVLLTLSFSFIRPGLLLRRAPTPQRLLLSTKSVNESIDDILRDLFLVSRSTIKWIQYRCGLSDWTTLPTTTWYVLNRLWLKPFCIEFIPGSLNQAIMKN